MIVYSMNSVCCIAAMLVFVSLRSTNLRWYTVFRVVRHHGSRWIGSWSTEDAVYRRNRHTVTVV